MVPHTAWANPPLPRFWSSKINKMDNYGYINCLLCKALGTWASLLMLSQFKTINLKKMISILQQFIIKWFIHCKESIFITNNSPLVGSEFTITMISIPCATSWAIQARIWLHWIIFLKLNTASFVYQKLGCQDYYLAIMSYATQQNNKYM